jgi:hypothetical protein
VEQFQVAHINVQGVNVVVVFVNPGLGLRPRIEQQQVLDALQSCASAAGLAGNVVLVWRDNAGLMNFIAPPNQHAFFRSVTFESLYGQINKTLRCG